MLSGSKYRTFPITHFAFCITLDLQYPLGSSSSNLQLSQIRILFRFLFAFFTSFLSVVGGGLDSSESKILDVSGIWVQSSVMASHKAPSLAFAIACLSFSSET
jgi:hypothetical protein